MPALSRARETAKNIQCASHLGQIGKGVFFYGSESNDRFPWAGQNPYDGRPDAMTTLPNLQVLFEPYFPRSEGFTCVNRPWASNERKALNLPWKRSPIWECPNDQYDSYYYRDYGSSYIYISETEPNGYATQNFWWRNLCYHRISEVEEPSFAIMILDANAGNWPRPHQGGMMVNVLCVDGHVESTDFASNKVGQWNFKTQKRYSY
jgi:prepilin-type processing-associated H-X9-DG protein